MKTTKEILMAARRVSPVLGALESDKKNNALLSMADAIQKDSGIILNANAQDMEDAKDNIPDSMQDRLLLTKERIDAMASGIREVAALQDPVGRELERVTRDNGLVIRKMSAPMGVIAIIYEARPNVTSDAAALAIKAGSACVLRSAKNALRSAFAITSAIKKGLESAGVPADAVNLVEDPSREGAMELMRATEYVDLLIPRGGQGLIRTCMQNALVPCIQTGTGICHIYVDEHADLEMALNIVENAKMSRPSVCNAAEVCLVHSAVAQKFLPMLKQKLTAENLPHKAQLRLDEASMGIIGGTPAGPEDFDTEFQDYILAVKIVSSINAAIDHIAKHSTHHSDAIITKDQAAAALFERMVDSAAVYVNASTRFTDGGEFGLGCEMGISTQKLHARGPMGLRELTTYKYVVEGTGQVR